MTSQGQEVTTKNGLDKIIETALTGGGYPDRDRLEKYHISRAGDEGPRKNEYLPSQIDIAAGCAEIRSGWSSTEERQRLVGLAPQDTVLDIPIVSVPELVE